MIVWGLLAAVAMIFMLRLALRVHPSEASLESYAPASTCAGLPLLADPAHVYTYNYRLDPAFWDCVCFQLS